MVYTKESWPAWLTASVLLLLLIATLLPYRGNITALFHMDGVLASEQPLPPNFVVLSVPAYDGAQYYLLSRKIPLLLNTETWPSLRERSPGSYAYQRILLPMVSFLASLGEEATLPYAFLLFNVASLILIAVLLRPPYGLALALSPAALIGLHFSLAEPLTLLLTTLFLLRFLRKEDVDFGSSFLLSLLILTGEVNVFLPLLLLIYLLWKRKYDAALLTVLPLLAFALWHGTIFWIFSDIPFLLSAGNRVLPGAAIVELLQGERSFGALSLSSIALFMLFVLPSTLWIAKETTLRRNHSFITLSAGAFLALMWIMSPNIWGAITSIGRVITPVYPLVLFAGAKEDTLVARAIALCIATLGVLSALGLAAIPHPFTFI